MEIGCLDIDCFYLKTFQNKVIFVIYFLFTKFIQKATLTAFSICGWSMTGCSIFVVTFFIVKNAPLIFQKAWDEDDKKKSNIKEKCFWKLLIYLRKILKSIYLFLSQIEVIYYLTYATLTLLGCTIHPFFFAFHLSEILMRLLFFLIFFSLNLFNFRFPLLKNVILAFWQPRKLLLLTFTLFLILEYISSLFGYTFFYSYYNGICESTLVCFLSTFDQTFKV